MLQIFESWDGLKLNFSRRDRNLWRDANLIAGVLLASTVIENGLGHLRYKHNPGYSIFGKLILILVAGDTVISVM